mgnify:CR=1 FL=1
MYILAEKLFFLQALDREHVEKESRRSVGRSGVPKVKQGVYVDNLNALHYTTVLSVWNAYDSAALVAENTVDYLELLGQT